jgi:hypothetical protein
MLGLARSLALIAALAAAGGAWGAGAAQGGGRGGWSAAGTGFSTSTASGRGGTGSGRPETPRGEVPAPDPARKVSEQDCSRPIVLDGGNLRCR